MYYGTALPNGPNSLFSCVETDSVAEQIKVVAFETVKPRDQEDVGSNQARDK